MKVWTIAITVHALTLGFAIGVTLSDVIEIVGVLAFKRVIGIKYLPFNTSIALMILANLIDVFIRRKSGKV